jgi:hypothetical protein
MPADLAELACSLQLVRRGDRPVSLGVVLAAWDPIHALRSVGLLQRHLKKLAGVTWSMVVVANNDAVLAELRRSGGGGFAVIAGSNQEAEFSAYEEGRQALLRQVRPAPGVWLILNDRFPAYNRRHLWDTRQLSCLNAGLLHLASCVEMASGQVNPFATTIPLWQHRLSCFIGSYWVLVSAGALDRAGPLRSVTATEFGLHAPASFPGYWPLSSWLGPELSGYIAAWLTGPGRWQRAEPLTAVSWNRLRFKALSIVNEKLLSARLTESGVPLVPWRQARAISQLDPGSAFLQTLLQICRDHPDRCAGIALNPRASLLLAVAIIATRAGLATIGERLLLSALHLGDAALSEWRSREIAARGA